VIERDSTWTHPVAKIVPHPITVHGDTRIDNYFWMRDRESPDVLAYLEAENAYQTAMMEPTVALQGQLYDEILGRIQEDDQSVPMRIDDWFYYGRTEKGKAYGIQCRKHLRVDAPEEILLDQNLSGGWSEVLSASVLWRTVRIINCWHTRWTWKGTRSSQLD
jgi:oligopeptidase B